MEEQSIPLSDHKEEQSIPQSDQKVEQFVPPNDQKEDQSVPPIDLKEEQSVPQSDKKEEQSVPQTDQKEEKSINIPQSDQKEEQSNSQSDQKEEQSNPQNEMQSIPASEIKEEQVKHISDPSTVPPNETYTDSNKLAFLLVQDLVEKDAQDIKMELSDPSTDLPTETSDSSNKLELVEQTEVENDVKEDKETAIKSLTESNGEDLVKEEVIDKNKGDEIDAKQIAPTTQVDANPFTFTTPPPAKKKELVSVPSQIDAKEYNISSSKIKKLIIINQKNFADHLGLSERRGTEHDERSIISTFKPLGWDIDVHNDLNLKQVRNLILDIQTADNDMFAALAIFILSHGEDNGTVFTYDGAYRIYNDILSPLSANKCSALAGRPKMIFVQACQGREVDSGTEVRGPHRSMSVGSRTSTDAAPVTYKIPNYADFLIYQASFCGHYSFRNSSTGSWFIQSLCNKIHESRNDQALFDILLDVSHGIAIEKESYAPQSPQLDMKKQVPLLYSTMIRKIYLKDRSEDEQDIKVGAPMVDASANGSAETTNEQMTDLKMNGSSSGGKNKKKNKKKEACVCM